MKVTTEELVYRQSLPLEDKIALSCERIESWWNYWEGQIYVSFSGGKDSTVLLDLVRNRALIPDAKDIPAVFVDTGLEYPEIKEFVRSIDNVVRVKPKLNFRQVIKKYGYPVISKKVSMGLDRYRNTNSDEQKQLRMFGGTNPTSGKAQEPSISKKWHFLIDAPFKVSEQCCQYLKKNPAKEYERRSGRKPIIGTMASDSRTRQEFYLRSGCNIFDAKHKLSMPMSFWKEQDVWDYIHKYNISYSSIYDMGYDRTGCMFCMFGVHLEEEPNRFQRMKETHPKIYEYCMKDLGLGVVLKYISDGARRTGHDERS